MQEWIGLLSWQWWVVIAGLCSGLAQVVGKRQVSYMSAFQSGVLRDSTILIIVGAMILMQNQLHFGIWSLSFLLIGILESVMIAAYYSASRDELASTVIFSYPLSSVLIVGLSGALFGEWQYFDVRTTVGLINTVSLAMVVGLMLLYQDGNLKKTRWSTKIILSSLMVVVSNIAIKWAVTNLGLMPTDYFLYEYIGLVGGGLMYVYWRGQSMRVGGKSLVLGAVQGLLFAISIILFAEILRSYPLSLASLIRRVVIVMVTVIAAFGWYKEGRALSLRQVVCLVGGVVVLGVVMLAN